MGGGGTFLAVPIIRIIVFWGTHNKGYTTLGVLIIRVIVFWGSFISGNYHMGHSRRNPQDFWGR